MTTLLQRGFARLNAAMQDVAAESVRYIRGATVISDAMPALLSAPQIQVVTDGGLSVVGRQFNWSVSKDELIAEGVRDQPRRNDVIEWICGGTTYAFEVLPDIRGSDAAASDPRDGFWPAAAKLISVTNE